MPNMQQYEHPLFLYVKLLKILKIFSNMHVEPGLPGGGRPGSRFYIYMPIHSKYAKYVN
jgi:hypothetical protein